MSSLVVNVAFYRCPPGNRCNLIVHRVLTLYHMYFMVIPYQQSDTMSTSKEEGERVEMVEVSDQTYSECQCTQKEHCTRFREIMESRKFSDPNKLKKEFKYWINANDISLTKKFKKRSY